jgi:hypothetical protein
VPRDRLDPPPPSEVRSSRHDDDRRGRREHRGDTWSSRLLHSLSHAPRERERERSESRRGSRRHRSPEHGGRRRHSSASNDPAGADNMDLHLEQTASETPHRLVTDTSPFQPARAVRLAEAPRHSLLRGRSRERTPHRRHHRQACSEPRSRMARPESAPPRLRCKSPDRGGSVSNNRHPSPSPPKVRANHVCMDDSSETRPPPAASSNNEPAPPPADAFQNNATLGSPLASPPPHILLCCRFPPRCP